MPIEINHTLRSSDVVLRDSFEHYSISSILKIIMRLFKIHLEIVDDYFIVFLHDMNASAFLHNMNGYHIVCTNRKYHPLWKRSTFQNPGSQPPHLETSR